MKANAAGGDDWAVLSRACKLHRGGGWTVDRLARPWLDGHPRHVFFAYAALRRAARRDGWADLPLDGLTRRVAALIPELPGDVVLDLAMALQCHRRKHAPKSATKRRHVLVGENLQRELEARSRAVRS